MMMGKEARAQGEVTVLIAEDDPGHAKLIQKNLQRGGIASSMIHFEDGQQVLDYLFQRGDGPRRKDGVAYVLLLDIRMPKVNGVEVLSQVKGDSVLRSMPVIVLSTADDPGEVKRCHELGCNAYISKPVDYEVFVEAVKCLGMFISTLQVPDIP